MSSHPFMIALIIQLVLGLALFVGGVCSMVACASLRKHRKIWADSHRRLEDKMDELRLQVGILSYEHRRAQAPPLPPQIENGERRGPGRPKGSASKRKTLEPEEK